MKQKSLALTLFATFLIAVSCYSQPLMKTLTDAPKLKTNSAAYIGQPLSKLLRDIGVPILVVTATEGNGLSESPGYFYFRFFNAKAADSLRALGKEPVSIVVYTKEPLVWDYKSRPDNKKFSWTPEDVARYGSLTVERLRVFEGKGLE